MSLFLKSKRGRSSSRDYRKTFHLLFEGRLTERQYFEWLQRETRVTIRSVKNRSNHRTDCQSLENLMKQYYSRNKEKINKNDEFWIVLDVDDRCRTEEGSFKRICGWTLPKYGSGVAVSNPRFEYWLLLHFESGNDIYDVNCCKSRLEMSYRKEKPEYNLSKNIPTECFTIERVRNAIDNARYRDNEVNSDNPYYTKVYLLAERILNSQIN